MGGVYQPMGRINLIEKMYVLGMNAMCKKDKEEKFLPVLMVTASLDCGGESVSSIGFGLCLWVEISTSPWMVHINLIKKKSI